MRPKNYPPSRLNEKGERTFAYLCPYKDKTHGEGCRVKNVHGNTLDAAVFHEVLKLAKLDGGLLPVLEALRRKIKNADESISSEQRLLLNEYKKKRAQIDNLVDSLKEIGEDSVSVHYIKEEIQRLDETCKDLQKEINHMEKRDEEAGGSCEWPEQAERVLRDPFELFKELTAEERREYLHGIVREVVWDGETAHIYVSAVLPAHYRSR